MSCCTVESFLFDAGRWSCCSNFFLKSDVGVILPNQIDFTTMFGCGDEKGFASTSAGCNGERPGRTSTKSFKLDVKNGLSSKQEKNDVVGDDPSCC